MKKFTDYIILRLIILVAYQYCLKKTKKTQKTQIS